MMNVIRSLDIRHIILSSSIYRSSSQSDFDQLMLLMYYDRFFHEDSDFKLGLKQLQIQIHSKKALQIKN